MTPTSRQTNGGGLAIRRLGEPGDLGWIVQAHGEVYANEFGWDTSFEAMVATIVAEYAAGHDPVREAGWIAELDGARVGCVLCVRDDDEQAKLRILLVHPRGRGHGAGDRLVTTCLDSPARRDIAGSRCGPTTFWPPRGASTCGTASP